MIFRQWLVGNGIMPTNPFLELTTLAHKDLELIDAIIAQAMSEIPLILVDAKCPLYYSILVISHRKSCYQT